MYIPFILDVVAAAGGVAYAFYANLPYVTRNTVKDVKEQYNYRTFAFGVVVLVLTFLAYSLPLGYFMFICILAMPFSFLTTYYGVTALRLEYKAEQLPEPVVEIQETPPSVDIDQKIDEIINRNRGSR